MAKPIDRMIARRLWNGSTAGPTASNTGRRMAVIGRSDSEVIAYATERVQGFPEWTITDQYPVKPVASTQPQPSKQ